MDHWGNDVVSWIYCFGKGGGYIQVVKQLYENDFLQNDMEKIINGIITWFLFNILKLLCSYFCTFILFSYINVCIEWFDESHLRETVYNLRKIGLNIFLF